MFESIFSEYLVTNLDRLCGWQRSANPSNISEEDIRTDQNEIYASGFRAWICPAMDSSSLDADVTRLHADHYIVV